MARGVVPVDDVTYTIYAGHTVRAALAIAMDHGRPGSVWLAGLIDRDHRRLPIRPSSVGRGVPTDRRGTIRVEAIKAGRVDRATLYRGK